ncbi:hypothetical protein HDU76_011718, partial [Blyttiomyces sp. JEL0837]
MDSAAIIPTTTSDIDSSSSEDELSLSHSRLHSTNSDSDFVDLGKKPSRKHRRKVHHHTDPNNNNVMSSSFLSQDFDFEYIHPIDWEDESSSVSQQTSATTTTTADNDVDPFVAAEGKLLVTATTTVDYGSNVVGDVYVGEEQSHGTAPPSTVEGDLVSSA